MAQDRHVLDVLFRDAREAVTVQDRSGNLIYANDRAADLVGFESGEQMLATPVAAWVGRFVMINEDGQPISPATLPGRLVLEGEDPPEMTIGYRVSGSRQVKWSRVNASPIKNDAGERVWAINYFLDITHQVREREDQRILREVHDALAGALRVDPGLYALARVLVPNLASWCQFHLVDEFGDLRAAAVYPDEPGVASLLGAEPTIPSDESRLQSRVLTSGRPEQVENYEEHLRATANSEGGKAVLDAVEDPDLGPALCLRLGTSSDALSTMTLIRRHGESKFDELDLDLLEAIAVRASVSLANARLFEREHKTAEALRRGLTPESIPDIAGVEIAARYQPLAFVDHVGGDFYDVIAIDEHDFALVIGDIEGKGIAAAAAVGMARQTVKTAIALDSRPAIVVGQLNRALLEANRPRMCTLAYVTLGRRQDSFLGTVTLAGHPPPMALRADGTIEHLGQPCPPAGVVPELVPKPAVFSLYPGDTLVAYTDGFSRRDQPAPETIEKFLQGRQSDHPDAMLEGMLGDFQQAGGNPHDDIALLAVRFS